jgi:hypothetical protein
MHPFTLVFGCVSFFGGGGRHREGDCERWWGADWDQNKVGLLHVSCVCIVPCVVCVSSVGGCGCGVGCVRYVGYVGCQRCVCVCVSVCVYVCVCSVCGLSKVCVEGFGLRVQGLSKGCVAFSIPCAVCECVCVFVCLCSVNMCVHRVCRVSRVYRVCREWSARKDV